MKIMIDDIQEMIDMFNSAAKDVQEDNVTSIEYCSAGETIHFKNGSEIFYNYTDTF